MNPESTPTVPFAKCSFALMARLRCSLMTVGKRRSCCSTIPPELIVEPFVWHEMVWCKDESVLMAVASMPYEESDYIRDYGMVSSGH